MTVKQWIELYSQGAITDDHLMVECLKAVAPAAPEAVLKELPPDILDRIAKYSIGYRREAMYVNYGTLPSDEQVAAARKWIENALVSIETKQS